MSDRPCSATVTVRPATAAVPCQMGAGHAGMHQAPLDDPVFNGRWEGVVWSGDTAVMVDPDARPRGVRG